jgi:protein-L-isoaspartate(D-aspartate) O-methyltransferase
MCGWIIPPAREPTKRAADFEQERNVKVQELVQSGYLRSERIKRALLQIPMEDFIPRPYRDYAYQEVPLPLPGEHATISCPHSYPLFYEPLGLDEGHKFLEIGTGSGYGAAVAREVVGAQGLVVSVEIDPLTYQFATRNLEKAGYSDVLLVKGDGGLGYPQESPYDRIAITAACHQVPSPLIEQLKVGGKLITPHYAGDTQMLVMLEKDPQRTTRHELVRVLYVPLRGTYGS